MLRPLAVLTACCAMLSAAAAGLFEYDRQVPFEVREIGRERRDGVVVRDITYRTLVGGRRAAYLIESTSEERGAGLLGVHWYEPPNPTSNRTEFLPDAIALAKRGFTSLLVEMMWSDPRWYASRDRAKDYEKSVQELKEIRRALDLLLAQPQVNPAQVAYIGHGFGAMFGTILAGADRRCQAYVLAAGTNSFNDWYFFGPPVSEAEKQARMAQLKALDPISYIGQAGKPVLLQFATKGKFVPRPVAEAFIAATKEPKTVRWYEAEHELNEEARRDRVQWLAEVMK